MTFQWNRIHKHEEQIEQDIYSRVNDQIIEHYGVEEIYNLTSEQIEEVQKFADELGEYNVMYRGFIDCINAWEAFSLDSSS
jgi:hypothetical protein